MSIPTVPFATTRAPHEMVASADGLATQAGLATLARGGNAVDAAIATNAAIAVTGPHLCGMGGDLFALVHTTSGPPAALDASGRAGRGVDAAALRAAGATTMPFRHDPASVTVPGCVDGWHALHERYGRLALPDVLAPAIRLAEDGFPASPLLVASVSMLDDAARANLHELATQARRPGALVHRPGVAQALRAIAAGGRDAWYGGPFGEGLVRLGGGVFTEGDLARRQADWVEPLGVRAFEHDIWTVPPGSQGYLALAGAWIADGLDLPADPDDPLWAHLLIEAASEAAFDRPAVLHEGADGRALIDPARLGPRRDRIDPARAGGRRAPSGEGDTTYLCAVDRDRMAVSLIQSNASGFGSWLVEPSTGVNLHNRGIGFSLEPGHPSELAPGRRPPHTLSPLLITRPDGSFAATAGTMGGDAQPQILLQVLTRLLRHEQSPARSVATGRWALQGTTGFDTWTAAAGPSVAVEGHAPASWAPALEHLGHRAVRIAPWDPTFGHAHVISAGPSGVLAGAADPRTLIGSCAGS